MVSKRFLIITGAVVLVLSFYAAVSLSQARTIPEGLLKRSTVLSSFRMSSRAHLGSAAHMIKVVAQRNSDGSLRAPLFIEIAGGSGVESI
jgi:hypothetical protein